MKPATWAELERFFRCDGWTEVRRTGDIHYEKELPDGELLRSGRSSGKSTETIGRDKFADILRVQLKVDAATFWTCVRTCTPVPRPAPVPPEAPIRLSAWIARRLERELGSRPDQIAERKLNDVDAQRLLDDFRSRPR